MSVLGSLVKGGGYNVPSNSDGEGTIVPVSSFDNGHLAPEEASWAIQYLVRVAVVTACVRV